MGNDANDYDSLGKVVGIIAKKSTALGLPWEAGYLTPFKLLWLVTCAKYLKMLVAFT